MTTPVYPIPNKVEGTTPRPDFVKALEGCLDYLWDGTRINRYNDGGVFRQRFICFALESVWSRQLALISVPALELLKYEIGVRLSASTYAEFLDNKGYVDTVLTSVQEARRKFVLQLIEEFSDKEA